MPFREKDATPKKSLKRNIALPLKPTPSTMLKLRILELPLLTLLLLLLLLFTLIPDLLLQHDTVHTSLQQRAHGSSLALEETEAVECH